MKLPCSNIVSLLVFILCSRWVASFAPTLIQWQTRLVSNQRHARSNRGGLYSSYYPYNENPKGSIPNAQDDEAQRTPLVKARLQISEDLVPLQLLGKATLPTTVTNNRNQTCLVLSPKDPRVDTTSPFFSSSSSSSSSAAMPALLVPINNDNQMRLLQSAQANQVLTLPVLLRLNALAVNRDDGLFDNLPWTTWTVDPLGRNRDAAGNPIIAKYHLGKRDAYNVMLGKDWGRSLVQDFRQNVLDNKNDDDDAALLEENEDVLARRLLELQLREARMDLAECDYRLAVAQSMDESWALEDEREIVASRVASLEYQLEELQKQESSTPLEIVDQVLTEIENQQNQAPFRGATGYAPKRDTSVDDGLYTSPYDMFKSILQDQLKAEVIGVVLENTSLLEGTTALGGVLVLRRITAKKTTTIAGETLSVSDETDDYGNDGVRGGEMIVVECDADEALGMSLACSVPLQVEQSIWERSSIMVQLKQMSKSSKELDEWESVDPELSVLVDGQAGNQSATERVAPLRNPRSTTSLFDTIINPPPTGASDELFPTDNPIQSLADLNRLSNEDKARTLLSLSNFEGRLPRPRAVRESEQNDPTMNTLDRLLLPLIDESVRREYYIRQALQNGDLDLAQELESSKSMRQIAKEKVQRAQEAGEPEVAAYWKKEADLYSSLRADVTQDEGTYSRSLDRDEWYERERRKSAASVDRKKFGNLLDGIE